MKLKRFTLSVAVVAMATFTVFGVRGADRISVAPMCSANWNQMTPYNTSAPIVDVVKAPLGCVGTAMSIVMKHWGYPAGGTGSIDYQAGGKSYSHTFASSYAWDSMLDSYSGSYSDEELAAVGTLMADCSYAAQTNWLTGGAMTSNGAKGMIEYFGYDCGMRYYQRSWFTDEEWDNIIYTELAEGRPVIYGSSTSGGHQFVLDGYDAVNKTYHVNWGMGGAGNGYYDLNALLLDLPNANYDYTGGHDALVNVKPAEAGSKTYPIMYLDGTLSTVQECYSRNEMVLFRPSNGRGFVSGSLGKIVVKPGFEFVDESGVSQFVETGANEEEVLLGWMTLGVDGDLFPSTGTYKVYPAFRCEGVWYRMMMDLNISGPLTLYASPTELRFVDENREFTYELGDVVPVGSDKALESDALMLNHSYIFNYELGCNRVFQGKVYLAAPNEDGSNFVAVTDPVNISLNAGRKTEFELRLNLYEMFVGNRETLDFGLWYQEEGDDLLYPINPFVRFSVSPDTDVDNPFEQAGLSTTLLRIRDAESGEEITGEPVLTMGHNYEVTYNLSTTDAISADLGTVILEDNLPYLYGEPKSVVLEAEDVATDTWILSATDYMLVKDKVYAFGLGGYYNGKYWVVPGLTDFTVYFEESSLTDLEGRPELGLRVTPGSDTVEITGLETDSLIEVFNLSGVRVVGVYGRGFDASVLTPGHYIVRAANQALRLIKR